jgi:seryl-tRNA synthetase
MLDLEIIKKQTDEVKRNIKNRCMKADIDNVLYLAEKRSQLISKIDGLRSQQKEIGKQIINTPLDNRTILIEKSNGLKKQLNDYEPQLNTIEIELNKERCKIPNMTHPDSPIGPDERFNKEINHWGDIPKFVFKPLDHMAIGAALNLIDFDSGTKVTGSNFYFFKNEAVLLGIALSRLALEILQQEGFTLYETPDMAKMKVLEGCGFNPRSNGSQIYCIKGTDLGMIATAEITLAGCMMDKIISNEYLPIKLGGISHCFRVEAGSYGRESRGLYRVHQFTKIEMFVFTRPEDSDAMHIKILQIEEKIYQLLGIPYRVVDICTGDLGGSAYRKFDLEAWMPGRGDAGQWGEITSASNCTDYQSRRLGIRFRRKAGQKTEFVHTLNGTAIAIPRTIIAILENYQQNDGSVVMPEILKPIIGFDKIKLPRSK